MQRRLIVSAYALGALLGASTYASPTHAIDDARWLTPTMIDARAHMFDPALNYLTFQHMDKMFATRTVEAGDDVWELPSKPVSLEGEYTVGDNTLGLEEFLEATSTNALVVVKDGNIVYETYRNGSDANTRFITYSVAKSYVSTLIGLALADGAIKSLDDKVIDYLPEMKGSGYERATIRDLLRMRSGVDWLEVYQFGSDTQLTQVHDNSLVAYKYRWCDYAADESQPGPNEPGAAFNYATLDTSVLGCIVEKAIGKTGAEYMSEKLWNPVGMENDAYWIMDGRTRLAGSFMAQGSMPPPAIMRVSASCSSTEEWRMESRWCPPNGSRKRPFRTRATNRPRRAKTSATSISGGPSRIRRPTQRSGFIISSSTSIRPTTS